MRRSLSADRDVRVDKQVDDGIVWWETVYRDWIISAWPTGPYVWSLRRESESGEEVVAEGEALTHEEASTELLDAIRAQDNLSTADFEWYSAAEEYEVDGEVGGASTPDGVEYNAEVVSGAYGWDIMSEGDEHYESDDIYDSPEQAISAAMNRVDELPRPGQQSLEDLPGFEGRRFKRGYLHGYRDAVRDEGRTAQTLDWDERRYDSPVGGVDDIKWWARVPGQEWVAAVEYLHPAIYNVDEETFYWRIEDENTGRTLAEDYADTESAAKREAEGWLSEQGGQLFAGGR